MGKCLFLRKGETHTAPISGILASDLAVGSSVYLMENGTAVEYLVVHQGLPSSLYDSSCDGMWVLRKDIYETRKCNRTNVNDYANSTIHAYLNGDFFNLFGSIEQEIIKQVKIPYIKGNGSGGSVASGSSGLSAKIFYLSGYEIGWTTINNHFLPVDGDCLSYFSGTASTDSKRIGYLNGAATKWWLRSPYRSNSREFWCIMENGYLTYLSASDAMGVRPALILPSNALFDKDTLILKGVA